MTKTVTVDQPLRCDLCDAEMRALTDCPVKIGGRTTWAHACDRCFADHGVETSVNTRLVSAPAGGAVTSRTGSGSGSPPTTTTKEITGVLSEVAAERRRQDEKWGEQNAHDFEWVSILTEEVGEAAAEANEANFYGGKNRGDYSLLRAELVQVAAVAVAWIEAIDRRTQGDPDGR